MKPRRGCVIAAFCVTLAALSVHLIAIILPFWQIVTLPTGDVTRGLWSSCLSNNGWSECWSHSTTEDWLDIVRTVTVMALFLLLLALVALVVYLLDISWKEILHAVTVIALLMVVALIIVGLIIYGLNSPTEHLHVSFCLALIAAVFALIAAILLLVKNPCCKCCQKRRKHDNHTHVVMDRESTIASTIVIEREPTNAWPEEDTKMTRRASQLSWNSSARVTPVDEKHTEITRAVSRISRSTSTPVKPFHDEKEHNDCKCCCICCLFTCCNRKRRMEMKRESEDTVCVTCGRDPYQRLHGINKSTSSTTLQHYEIATSSTWSQHEPTQQANVKQMHGNTTVNAHHVTTGINYDNRPPTRKNRYTCMTPQHANGERNRTWNQHKSIVMHCGRVVSASAFSVNQGPHAPCPFSAFCCRCKHAIQNKSPDSNPNEPKNGQREEFLCDCKLSDVRLCDKCIAKRKVNSVVQQSKNQRPTAKTSKPNTHVYHSNAAVHLKQTHDDQDDDSDKIKNSIDKLPQRKQVGKQSSNDDSSEFQPSDYDNDLTYDNKEDRTSEHAEGDTDDNFYDDMSDDEKKHPIHQDAYTPHNGETVQQTKPTKSRNGRIRDDAKSPVTSRKNGGETPVTSSTKGGETPVTSSTKGGETPVTSSTKGGETPVTSSTNGGETPHTGDKQSQKPVARPSKNDTITKPPAKPENTNEVDTPQDSNKKQKKPRVLSHNDNNVDKKPPDPKRPKSESDANANGPVTTGDDSNTNPKKKKKKHKWVPPKWKGNF